MPRVTNGYGQMEVVVTPRTTYITVEHINDNRRIYTDGRDWPIEIEPTHLGYSIGTWIDTDGDVRRPGGRDARLQRSPHLRCQWHSLARGQPDYCQGTDLHRQIRSQHLPRRSRGDRSCADAPLDRDQELPSRDRSPAQLARGHLRREQQPCGDRTTKLHAEPRRTPDADEEGPASARPAIFQSLPQAGAVGAIADNSKRRAP